MHDDDDDVAYNTNINNNNNEKKINKTNTKPRREQNIAIMVI